MSSLRLLFGQRQLAEAAGIPDGDDVDPVQVAEPPRPAQELRPVDVDSLRRPDGACVAGAGGGELECGGTVKSLAGSRVRERRSPGSERGVAAISRRRRRTRPHRWCGTDDRRWRPRVLRLLAQGPPGQAPSGLTFRVSPTV